MHTACMSQVVVPKHSRTEAAIRAGQRIRAAREQRGLTLEKLARKTGHVLTASRISNYEQGLREPSVDVANQLAIALDVPAAWLLGVISDADRELLSYPPEVRLNALSMLRATVRAARETTAPYVADGTPAD